MSDEKGWRAIESAPKDGTWILACSPSDDRYALVPGFRLAPRVVSYDRGGSDGFVWATIEGSDLHRTALTHWIPIPEPPAPPDCGGVE